MSIQFEKLQAEEKELEARLFAAPKEADDQGDLTSKETDEQRVAPTEGQEAVTSTPQSAPDEHQNTTREQEDWEKRYKHLRNSRDEKLHDAKTQLASSLETVRALQQKNQELREEIETLRANIDPFDKLFSPEEVDVLGDSTVDVIKKASRRAADAATADLKKQLKEERELRAKQQEIQAKSTKTDAYNVFIDRLAQMVPDWQDVNADPEFVKYCHSTYDIDGSLVADTFSRAEAHGDATTIARYMIQYKSDRKVLVENPLEAEVNPKGKTGGAPTKQAAPVIVDRAEINKFYDDLARGLYKGKRQLADELEAKYDLAVTEGRIR